MAHVHSMRDADSHFTVDPISRSIKNNGTKNILIQYDHNSEIFTFEMPRYIDGHDMTLCNRVEIHYLNVGGSEIATGVYEVTDFEPSEDEENTIVWSWTISNNATMHTGTLSFAFRFACVEEDATIKYSWSTAPHNGIVISAGIYNGEEVVEEYKDILELWEHKIGVGVDDLEQTVESKESEGVNVITLILTDGSRESFRVRNGKTPVRGVDYWTDEDKEEIINSILEVIPRAEEASF